MGTSSMRRGRGRMSASHYPKTNPSCTYILARLAQQAVLVAHVEGLTRALAVHALLHKSLQEHGGHTAARRARAGDLRVRA